MKNNKKITLEEQAVAYIPAHNLSPEEKKEADQTLHEERLKLLLKMTGQEKLYYDLLGLRMRMEGFINGEKEGVFNEFLQDYLHLINKKNKDFALEIDLHPTKLSRLLNDKEKPNIAILYRLEKHSGNTIPAILWWKVINKELEENIKFNDEVRTQEAEKVKNALSFAK